MRNILLGDVQVADGSIDACSVDPREVFAPALAMKAFAIILAHNHSSGNPTPRKPDLLLTNQLGQGVRLLGLTHLDHIVIGDNGNYWSIRQHDQLDTVP